MRVGLTEKFPVGISVVIEKVKSVDKRFQVCDKTMSALMVAERKINDTDQLLNLAAHSWNILVKWCFLQSSNSWAGRWYKNKREMEFGAI
ncbi:hypothetical protein OROMI_000967 [Orobanche minor]